MKIKYRNIFKKDVKRAKKRGKDLAHLKRVIDLLVTPNLLPEKYRDHTLIGQYRNRRECHIEPDWLLIYKREANVIIFERTGTHADLFKSG